MTPLDIKDIKGPILIQEGSTTLVFVGLLLILLIGLFLLYWIRMKKKKIPRPLPPHEIALAALERLKRKGVPGAEGTESFCVELSRIIREYLDRRFGPGRSEMTTEECLRKIQETEIIPDEAQSHLKTLLTHCDLVKFAGQKPSPEEADTILKMAQRMIEQTKEPLSP